MVIYRNNLKTKSSFQLSEQTYSQLSLAVCFMGLINMTAFILLMQL